nr:MAG TPA: hypothetical protein [Caudoviricetes sp.]
MSCVPVVSRVILPPLSGFRSGGSIRSRRKTGNSRCTHEPPSLFRHFCRNDGKNPSLILRVFPAP